MRRVSIVAVPKCSQIDLKMAGGWLAWFREHCGMTAMALFRASISKIQAAKNAKTTKAAEKMSVRLKTWLLLTPKKLSQRVEPKALLFGRLQSAL